jgi:hypothetical protein
LIDDRLRYELARNDLANMLFPLFHRNQEQMQHHQVEIPSIIKSKYERGWEEIRATNEETTEVGHSSVQPYAATPEIQHELFILWDLSSG